MKHVLIIVTLALLFVGCSKEDQKPHDETDKYSTDSSEIKLVPLKNQSESFYLKYAFEKGKNYNYRLTNIAENEQQIQANDTSLAQKVKQTLTYLINLDILDIDVDSIYEIAFKITSVKLEANLNDQKFYFESSTSKDSLDKIRYSEYIAVVNNPFHVRMNKSGEIIEIYKADRIVNEFLKLKGAEDSLSSAEKDFLKNDMIERALKPLVVQIFREFTNKAVSKDSAWTNPQEPSKLMIFQVQNTNSYKISSIDMFNDEKIANIEAGLLTKITGNSKYVDRNITYNFKTPVTSAEGRIYFNLDKGCIQKSKTQSKIQLSYTMEISTPQGTEKGSKSETVLNTNILELL